MYQSLAKNRESNDPSRVRFEGLLHSARSAEMLAHNLRMLDIEGAHRLAWHSSHFNPDQPRVPAGRPDGGEWTRGGTVGNGQTASDVTPENSWKPGRQYAQSRGGRGSVPIRIGGQLFEVEPGQAARWEAAAARAEEAIRRVREIEPHWRPKPGAYATGIESEIRRANDLTVEAEARIAELQRVGIGPGPFACEHIPARGETRNLRAEERDQLNRMGSKWGCHTCGTKDPGTASGNFVGDHQRPISWGRPERIYPQCVACSNFQGGWLRQYRGSR
jgi:hypothetical protein